MASSHVSRITAGGVSDRRIAHSLYGYCTTAAATAGKVVNLYTGSSTTADGSWTAADLFHGLTIEVRFQYTNTVANPTLNVNGTGAKSIFRYGTTAPTTSTTGSWQNQLVVTLVYDTLLASTGCWVMEKGYRTANDNTIGYQVRSNYSTRPASDKGYRYRIWLSSPDNELWVPINVSTSAADTTEKTLNTRPINPFGDIIYYSVNETTNAGDVLTKNATWEQYPMNIGYSYIVDNWTINKSVYLKCTPLTNGSAIMLSIVQDLPTTRDGKIYIYLGVAHSATAMLLKINHPVYYHNGDGIRLWSGQQVYGGGEIRDILYQPSSTACLNLGSTITLSRLGDSTPVNIVQDYDYLDIYFLHSPIKERLLFSRFITTNNHYWLQSFYFTEAAADGSGSIGSSWVNNTLISAYSLVLHTIDGTTNKLYVYKDGIWQWDGKTTSAGRTKALADNDQYIVVTRIEGVKK